MQDAGITKNEYRVNALNRELVRSIHRDIAARKDKYAPPFDEKEAALIGRCFAESDESCVSAFYLCLYAHVPEMALVRSAEVIYGSDNE